MKFRYLVFKHRVLFKLHDWLFRKDYFYCEPFCETEADHLEAIEKELM